MKQVLPERIHKRSIIDLL